MSEEIVMGVRRSVAAAIDVGAALTGAVVIAFVLFVGGFGRRTGPVYWFPMFIFPAAICIPELIGRRTIGKVAAGLRIMGRHHRITGRRCVARSCIKSAPSYLFPSLSIIYVSERAFYWTSMFIVVYSAVLIICYLVALIFAHGITLWDYIGGTTVVKASDAPSVQGFEIAANR